jgi:hypothetical protein
MVNNTKIGTSISRHLVIYMPDALPRKAQEHARLSRNGVRDIIRHGTSFAPSGWWFAPVPGEDILNIAGKTLNA